MLHKLSVYIQFHQKLLSAKVGFQIYIGQSRSKNLKKNREI
jgi:hypothetical protein